MPHSFAIGKEEAAGRANPPSSNGTALALQVAAATVAAPRLLFNLLHKNTYLATDSLAALRVDCAGPELPRFSREVTDRASCNGRMAWPGDRLTVPMNPSEEWLLP